MSQIGKSWLVHIIYLWFTLNVICANKILYGIVLLKYHEKFVTISYTAIRSIDQKIDKLNIFDESCPGTNLSECLNKIKEKMRITNVPNSEIFLKIVFVLSLDRSVNKINMPQILPVDKEILSSYWSIPQIQYTERFTTVLDDILIFESTAIDLIKGELDATTVTIIIRNQLLFVSFITLKNQSSTNLVTYDISYNNQLYTVVAHTFKCASLTQVELIIYKILIENSKNLQVIKHPCIHKQSTMRLNPNEANQSCVSDFEINDSILFTGDFNFDKCQDLIQKAIVYNKFKYKLFKTANFKDIAIPLLETSNYNLKFYTDLLKDEGSKYIDKAVFTEKKSACSHDSQPTEKSLHLQLTNDCLKYIYLEFLMDTILGIKYDQRLPINGDNPAIQKKRFMFTDPRLGAIIEKVNQPSTEDKSSSVTSTLEPFVSETAIPETFISETATPETSVTEISTQDISSALLTSITETFMSTSETLVSTSETLVSTSETYISTSETLTTETLMLISETLISTTVPSTISLLQTSVVVTLIPETSTMKLLTTESLFSTSSVTEITTITPLSAGNKVAIGISIIIFILFMTVLGKFLFDKFIKTSESDL